MVSGGGMIGRLGVLLVTCAIVLALGERADADVFFDRAFGVGAGGGVGFENCTTASGCVGGVAAPGAGGLSTPHGIAVDAQGRILVAEQLSHRVSRFVVAADGTVSFDRAFGVGVDTGALVFENCTTASSCQGGIASGDAGGLAFPQGIAVDAAGRILVAENLNQRVSRFVVAADGTVSFDRAFGVGVDTGAPAFENCTAASGCQGGFFTFIPGALVFPQGIAVDAAGRILVTEGGNLRVSRFVVNGDGSVSFDRAFGTGVQTGAAAFENCTTGTGCLPGAPSGAAGGFSDPGGVAVDAQGRILVTEGLNHRVSRFTVGGDGTVSFDRAFGVGVDTGAAVLESCTTATGCQPGALSDVAGALGFPAGVAVDRQGRILVTAGFDHRVSRFTVGGDGTVTFDRAFGVGVDTGAATFENCTTTTGCQAGVLSGAAGGLSDPRGIAVDARGRILVADGFASRVSRFTMYGVAYDGNGHTGGAVPVDDNTYETGDPVTVAANTGGLVRTGHTLGGWNTQANGGGASFDATGTDTFAMGTVDVTLFARWILSVYTVSFDENGGSFVPNQLVAHGSPATEPLPPTRAGHAFGGWFADPGFTNPFDFATPITADRTLFAAWTLTGTGPDPAIAKIHTGLFSRGQVGAYQITVTNAGNAATAGVITVADVLPAGLTALAISGTGWSCVLAPLTCTRADALAPAAAYPVIVVTVTAAVDAPLLVVNTAIVLGGGDVDPANNTASDPTAIVPTDVAGHPFLQWIAALIEAAITSGCSTSPPAYCPDATVSRAEIAVFLLRGIHGAGYQPPAPTGLFTDVPVTGNPITTHPFAAWIEQLFAEGITGGCGPSVFCPDAGVSRGQMALFLLRAKHGAGYQPPAPTGLFADVPVTGNPATTHPFAAWIEQLFAEGITGGCGGNFYCPEATVTRGQMAVFLARVFGLLP